MVAAWTRNELDKRLSWLSPTYRQWNPKLPWGTDYETLTEQPPGIPSDPANARLEPWRRWNWITDGTPNKWLNCPYEFPWNSAAGQLSLPFNLGDAVEDFAGPPPPPTAGYNRLDLEYRVATPDLAVWNPSAYENRPAPSEGCHTHTITDSEQRSEGPDIVLEREEVIVQRRMSCMNIYTTPLSYKQHTVPVVATRWKGAVYADDTENSAYEWPILTNPVTGVDSRPQGTVYSWSTPYTLSKSGFYNLRKKWVFVDNRQTPATLRWNLVDENYSEDDRHVWIRHYQDEKLSVRPAPFYYCQNDGGVTSEMWFGTQSIFETLKISIPRGLFFEHKTTYTDEFKYGAYQKKVSYPCYLKPPKSDYYGNNFGKRWTNMEDIPGAEGSSYFYYYPDYEDLKPEARGTGNIVLEVDEDQNAPNTWYSKYSYKPSQHWADGWGIRCESTNFHSEPQFRIGKIYNDAGGIGEAEKDPLTKNYNPYFWPGMHKELYPMVVPGRYEGGKIVGDNGLTRAATAEPTNEQEVYAYYQANPTADVAASTPMLMGQWFTMPVKHYSANDLYKTICKQKNFVYHPERPNEVIAALGAINVPGQPGLLTPPTTPTKAMLDTTYLFNHLCLVPTDFVQASMVPPTIVITGIDAQGAAVKTPIEPIIDRATLELKPIAGPNGDIEDIEYEIKIRGGYKKTDGGAAVPPVVAMTYDWGPPVRPEFATLANYPTGFEIEEAFYPTIKTRLTNETEMNHRSEGIPNWLDSDGGLLFYISKGVVAGNEGCFTETSYFNFIKQARIPFWNRQHPGMFITIELMFSKKVETWSYTQVERTGSHKTDYSVERRTVMLDFPTDSSLLPEFDEEYFPADTNPDRSEKNPPKNPSVWKGESTHPEYGFKDMSSGTEKIGSKKKDKRDWQTHGPSKQQSFSIVTSVVDYNPGEETRWYTVKRSKNVWTYPTDYRPYQTDDQYWPTIENVDDSYEVTGMSMEWTTTTTLDLIDVKIIKIQGAVYRADGEASSQPG